MWVRFPSLALEFTSIGFVNSIHKHKIEMHIQENKAMYLATLATGVILGSICVLCLTICMSAIKSAEDPEVKAKEDAEQVEWLIKYHLEMDKKKQRI